MLEELAGELSPRVLEAPARLDQVRRELDEYFEGRRDGLRPADRLVATRAASPREVLRADRAHRLRRGVAPTPRWPSRAGSPRAVRAAGNALGANPIPVVVPCHRVLRTGGALGGYTGGLERKEFLLRLEGVLALASRPSGEVAEWLKALAC